jgi:hypothetical protein
MKYRQQWEKLEGRCEQIRQEQKQQEQQQQQVHERPSSSMGMGR